ncbi:MAG: hypothetical protein AAGA93_19040 [Actinomycetota bacterium]
MSTSFRTAIAAATLLTATVVGATGPASARPVNDGPTDLTWRPPTCTPLPANHVDVELDELGNGNIRVIGDRVASCDEAVVLWSIVNSSSVVDNHEPIIDEIVLQVADLEAAGPKGIDFSIELDPCWAGFQVLRDGDSLVHEEMIGDGCEMTVAVDFTSAPSEAEIHVVQQTGTIAPPHIWTVTDDQVTNLTGLPSGTWYVKVYDGFTPDSSISVDAAAPTAADTVYGVGHDATVDVTIVTELGFSAKPAPSDPVDFPVAAAQRSTIRGAAGAVLGR